MVAASARAQPLADRVPADAILYVGWAGADAVPGYAQSRLKAVLDQSTLQAVLRELPARVIARAGQAGAPAIANPHLKKLIDTLVAVGDVAWRRPAALYVGPVNLAERLPIPRLALFCEAGPEAKAIADRITALVKQLPPDAPVNVRAQVWPGDVLVVSTFEIGARVEESLSQREPFKAALKHGRPDPALVAYLDLEKVVNVASLGITLAADDNTKTLWRQILATTGLGGVKRLLYTGGFDGQDWGTQAFVDAPAPRAGLLANLLSTKPVGDDLLEWAPKGTTWLAATRMDLAEALRLTRVVTSRLAPEQGLQLERAIEQINALVGLDVQKDLLAALGDQWLVYTSEQTGVGLAGLCLVCPLRDKAKAEAGLLKLMAVADQALAKGPREAGVDAAIRTEQIAGLTVHRLPMPAFDPCWTIKGDNLYVALYPQVLLAATAHDGSADKSVLANEKFLAARKRLGGAGETTITYADLPALAPRGYPIFLALLQGGQGALEMFDLAAPGMILPPLDKLAPHLAPAAGAAWTTDAGWHCRSVTPFPLAGLLAGEQGLITVAPVALPAVILATPRSRRDIVPVAPPAAVPAK
ncbi:MAG TPA: hypothetical protein VK986_10240 [Tepidisphaeraceae bacterium]|nr:hypothetical protein [Tepidisphaeraceae bacterium]